MRSRAGSESGRGGNGRRQGASGRTRILIADDSRVFRHQLAYLLASQGEVEVVGMAKDGGETVQLAERLHPDVILMDHNMPGTTGAEATARIRQSQLPVRIYFIAAEPSVRRQALRAGADGFFVKGTDLSELFSALQIRRRPGAPPRAVTLGKRTTRVLPFSLLVVLALALLGIWPVLSPATFLPGLGLSFGLFFFLYALKYYGSVALILLASAGNGNGNDNGRNGNGKGLAALSNYARGNNAHVKANGSLAYQPFVSIHLPLYNEKEVVERLLTACTSLEYANYEVVVADDSTDETTEILRSRWGSHPRVKISHRQDRRGFKGGALQWALHATDPRAEFIVVFDADFIPPPDILQQFLAYFYGLNGRNGGNRGGTNGGRPALLDPRVAVVQGYQWHVLNASENWITRGIRTEFSGSYVVERAGQQLLDSMRMISGSVFMIRADVLRKHGWSTSITEDWELTLRLYLDGYKVLYTPFVQAPAECVSSFKQLARQRMRWAEGHTFNVKRYFGRVLASRKLTWREKAEFLYYTPYYLQSAFFMLGTLAWFLSELVFHQRLPFWSEVLGWSLVFTNTLSLGLMNLSGLFLERGVKRSWAGLLSFLLLTYLLVPYQAYASLKGLLEREEGGWHRTQKTGIITEVIERLGLARRMRLLRPKRKQRPIDLGKRLGMPAFSLPQWLSSVGGLLLGRRSLAWRLIALLTAISIGLGALGRLVPVATAAPDVFYLHDTATSGITPAGRYMNTTIGSGGSTMAFDTTGQTAYWYADQTWPTGGDPGGIAAGNYFLNMYFSELPRPWWNTDYVWRRRITVSAGAAAVPSGYTVSLTGNHANMVFLGQSQADGDDIRIVYWNGSSWVELDRILDPTYSGNGWNQASTRILFKLQAGISASASDSNYYLYHGYSLATSPPASESNVWRYYNPLNSTAGLTQFGNFCASGLSISGGRLTFTSSDYGSDPAGTGCGAYDTNAPALSDVEILADLEVASGTAFPRIGLIFREQSTFDGYAVRIKPNPGDWRIGWVGTNASWNQGLEEPQSSAFSTVYRFRVRAVGSTVTWWFRTLSGSYQATGQTCTYGSGSCAGAPSYGSGGFGFWNEKSDGGNWYDDLRVRFYVNPEPTTSLGAAQTQADVSVGIRVTVSHTAPDGSGAVQIVQSIVYFISSSTTNPFALWVGNGSAQTFTSSDPRRLRLLVEVTQTTDERFVLAYDGSCAANRCSNLSTPVVTVPEAVVGFVAASLMIPLATGALRKRTNVRRLRRRS